MVYTYTSDDKRQKFIKMVDEGVERNQAAEICGIGIANARMIYKKYKRTGEIPFLTKGPGGVPLDDKRRFINGEKPEGFTI